MSELDAFESWAGHFRARLEALARRAALHDIARELRRSQQAPYLRTETEATGVAIGFAGRIARVARTHQLVSHQVARDTNTQPACSPAVPTKTAR
jgi:hypothetical protein